MAYFEPRPGTRAADRVIFGHATDRDEETRVNVRVAEVAERSIGKKNWKELSKHVEEKGHIEEGFDDVTSSEDEEVEDEAEEDGAMAINAEDAGMAINDDMDSLATNTMIGLERPDEDGMNAGFPGLASGDISNSYGEEDDDDDDKVEKDDSAYAELPVKTRVIVQMRKDPENPNSEWIIERGRIIKSYDVKGKGSINRERLPMSSTGKNPPIAGAGSSGDANDGAEFGMDVVWAHNAAADANDAKNMRRRKKKKMQDKFAWTYNIRLDDKISKRQRNEKARIENVKRRHVRRDPGQFLPWAFPVDNESSEKDLLSLQIQDRGKRKQISLEKLDGCLCTWQPVGAKAGSGSGASQAPFAPSTVLVKLLRKMKPEEQTEAEKKKKKKKTNKYQIDFDKRKERWLVEKLDKNGQPLEVKEETDEEEEKKGKGTSKANNAVAYAEDLERVFHVYKKSRLLQRPGKQAVARLHDSLWNDSQWENSNGVEGTRAVAPDCTLALVHQLRASLGKHHPELPEGAPQIMARASREVPEITLAGDINPFDGTYALTGEIANGRPVYEIKPGEEPKDGGEKMKFVSCVIQWNSVSSYWELGPNPAAQQGSRVHYRMSGGQRGGVPSDVFPINDGYPWEAIQGVSDPSAVPLVINLETGPGDEKEGDARDEISPVEILGQWFCHDWARVPEFRLLRDTVFLFKVTLEQESANSPLTGNTLESLMSDSGKQLGLSFLFKKSRGLMPTGRMGGTGEALGGVGTHSGEWRGDEMDDWCKTEEIDAMGYNGSVVCAHAQDEITEEHWSCCGVLDRDKPCTQTKPLRSATQDPLSQGKPIKVTKVENIPFEPLSESHYRNYSNAEWGDEEEGGGEKDDVYLQSLTSVKSNQLLNSDGSNRMLLGGQGDYGGEDGEGARMQVLEVDAVGGGAHGGADGGGGNVRFTPPQSPRSPSFLSASTREMNVQHRKLHGRKEHESTEKFEYIRNIYDISISMACGKSKFSRLTFRYIYGASVHSIIYHLVVLQGSAHGTLFMCVVGFP